MKRIYLNELNNIALVIDDDGKKYTLLKARTAHKIRKARKIGLYWAKLAYIREQLKLIKSAGYQRAKKG